MATPYRSMAATSEVMERNSSNGDGDLGVGVTKACRVHLTTAEALHIRQTRRRCCQTVLLGCEARTEFKYYNQKGKQIAYSLEDANCCCRVFCPVIHPFHMRITEVERGMELLAVDRPYTCPASNCKCCCYQTAHFRSGGNYLGTIQETCYVCAPSFNVTDAMGAPLYILRPPTCCGGICVNYCTEGNPCCGRGYCKVPFWIFDPYQGDRAQRLGKILKKPKSLFDELFTHATAFEVHFPARSTVEQKAVLVGSTIFLNAVFFEGDGETPTS